MNKIPRVEVLPVDGGCEAVCAFELVALHAERVVALPGAEFSSAARLAAAHAAFARLLALLTTPAMPLQEIGRAHV